MASKITTVQGDMWDTLALKHLGSEMRMHELMAANPDHVDIVKFSAGIVLTLPETAGAAVTKYPQPPWKSA